MCDAVSDLNQLLIPRPLFGVDPPFSSLCIRTSNCCILVGLRPPPVAPRAPYKGLGLFLADRFSPRPCGPPTVLRFSVHRLIGCTKGRSPPLIPWLITLGATAHIRGDIRTVHHCSRHRRHIQCYSTPASRIDAFTRGRCQHHQHHEQHHRHHHPHHHHHHHHRNIINK